MRKLDTIGFFFLEGLIPMRTFTLIGAACACLTFAAIVRCDEPKADTKAAPDLIAQFFTDYQAAMKDVENKSTTVKRGEAIGKAVERLDKKLTGQTWVFHCRIKDVSKVADGWFKLTCDQADELQPLGQSWEENTSAVLPLTREQANNLNPGEYVVFSGTPRLITNRFPGNADPDPLATAISEIASGKYRSDQNARQFNHLVLLSNDAHSVDLTRIRFRVQKSAKP
jgi:hypothetical protein